MTAICMGGASAQRSGTSSTVLLTSAAIASLLPLAGLAWLEPYVGYLAGTITLELPAFCTIDPPADPGISAADLIALVALGAGPLTAGPTAKLTQLIQRAAWPAFCECTSATTPTLTPISPPAGAPDINPQGPTGPGVAGPCAVFISDPYSYVSGGGLASLIPFTGIGGSLNDDVMLPSGATNVRIITSVSTGTATTGVSGIVVNFFDSDRGAFGGSGGNAGFGYNETIGHTTTTDVALVAPIGGIAVLRSGGTMPAGTNVLSARVEVYCGGPPGSTSSPCCPPDPIATAKLDQIMALLTLIQRQAAPFAYVTGAVHSALSGDGSFSIGSILGLLLNVSVPARAGRAAGTPVTIFDCGWLNFATLDGYTERYFVGSDSQVILPRLPGIYTDVGYSFAPDVSVTVTEILREP